jgi:septum formation protein
MIGVKTLIVPADIDETIGNELPRKLVIRHARNKARAVAEKFDSETIIVGADTIVFHGGMILGKPADQRQAMDYLTRLSGSTHTVYTGVCVIRGARERVGIARTHVRFHSLTAEDIGEYIATGEPMDKAGAYGIQGFGSQFIAHISGCYFNVMGFPVSLFRELLTEICR